MNHLAKETSPYLLQHADNPVDWWPWCEEALEKARKEDKVIFLSIGYSACHWCHVMEHESFENPEIAAKLNAYFVNIKVDREERPDLDEIYMTATQALTGSGGWPMSVFLTPELKPFFAGTYFPPEDRMGMPGFARVVEHVHDLWTRRREEVRAHSEQLAAHLDKVLRPQAAPGEPRFAMVDRAAGESLERFDSLHGGFAGPPHYAPKFPHAMEMAMLLRHWARTHDQDSLRMVTMTLDAMAAGGIHDQLGGGFHRYSTDRRWLVPHFEKMLYDNAQLGRLYCEAMAATGEARYGEVARDVFDWMLAEMQDPQGGFWSTQDADSEGEEGKFFVWTKREIEQVLGEDAALACLHWGVTEQGNWEGRNVLHVAVPVEECAERLGLDEAEARERLERARRALLAARARRARPGTDDKVLAAWNGLAIGALAYGHQVLGEERYLHAAQRAAAFVLDRMRDERGRLLRTWRDGQARLPAYLEDYAFLAEGLLCLFESDGDPRWLSAARALLEDLREHFLDPRDGGFFFTADDHERLITRAKSVTESSTPSGQGMAAIAFLRAGLLLGDPELESAGAGALRAAHAVLERFPSACPTLLVAIEWLLGDPREVVVAGSRNDPRTRALLATAWRRFPPHRVVAVLDEGNRSVLGKLSPVFEGKKPVGGAPAAYVCRRGVCEAPVTDPAAITW